MQPGMLQIQRRPGTLPDAPPTARRWETAADARSLALPPAPSKTMPLAPQSATKSKPPRQPPKRPTNGQVSLLDFVAKPARKARAKTLPPTPAAEAKSAAMRATAKTFVPGSATHQDPTTTDAARPVGTKKKKKSTLKKKILRDRAAKWEAYHRAKAGESSALPTGDGNPEAARSVTIDHLVSVDEIEDDDEYEDTLADVRVQLERHGAVAAIDIDRSTGTVTVTYNDSASADAAVAALHTATFGGRQLLCLYATPATTDAMSWVTVAKYLEPADLADDDEFDEVRDEAHAEFSKLHPVQAIEIDRNTGVCRLQYASPSAAMAVTQQYDTKPYGGTPIRVEWAGGQVAPATRSPLTVDVPPVRKLRNASAIRAYVDQEIDECGELQVGVTALLGRLMQLQERARLTNPLKAKKTRRLVFGLREVKRGLKSLKVMCLLVAYDVDECAADGGLDDKIVELIDLARANKIPVVFALSKRKLGKAVLKTIRVSCVGIYSVDGANDMWTSVQKSVASLQHRRDAAEAATESMLVDAMDALSTS
ncbi:hypothetical protein SDRG_07389 [Saprolegnia diclina VS20]|uniref:RRM domain-containing protein n=1 Tax=Saprolegnia diclina (strain VS20) TaxID=1156394 RepID=T0RXS7_SAPDV|nr:hypothetical protein SDRG_07389 [Saprolegnia diclina VS20]EQC35157.1 hypothetical protein SDRG_07389 [Saprolegnia diclina VS20]|eukprot:XP_008611441.1 hypothetical protein SDRG_07389 [Saprolegnia diclina VS20]